MLDLLTQNLPTLLVGAVVLAVLAAIVVSMVRKRRRGGASCHSSCAGCPGEALCHGHHK